jgi:hypothetical protein
VRPSIGRVVIYRSRTGGYDVPAIITATTDTLASAGVEAWKATDGKAGVPPLSSPDHVHLTVFTPGIPGQRAGADDFLVESEHGRGENVSGCYQEWDIPQSPHQAGELAPDASGAGTWRWPERVS